MEYKGLGVFLDLTKLDVKEGAAYKNQRTKEPEGTTFSNTGMGGMVEYTTINRLSPTDNQDYSGISVSKDGLLDKEDWMRDQLGETINKRTGRISSTGCNTKELDGQQRYLNNKQAWSTGIDAISSVKI